MSPCLCLYVSIFYVSISMSPCPHVSMSPCLHVYISMRPEFRKWKTELTENGNFRLFWYKQKTETATSVCLLENGNGKQKFVFLGRQTRNGSR
jgi:hypothetical protein